MKKIIIVILIVAASTVFAAKEPLVFAPGFEGFLGNYTQAQIDSMVTTYKTNYIAKGIFNITVVVIDGTTAEDTLQITKLTFGTFSLVIKSPIKAIKSKIKIPSLIYHIELPGDEKTQIKLPKFIVYAVIAYDLKVLQCETLFVGAYIINSINGVTAKFKKVGNDVDNIAWLYGRFKSLSSKEFSSHICACGMYAPTGKFVKLKAKKAMQSDKFFHVWRPQVKFLKKPDKNGYWIKNINAIEIMHP